MNFIGKIKSIIRHIQTDKTTKTNKTNSIELIENDELTIPDLHERTYNYSAWYSKQKRCAASWDGYDLMHIWRLHYFGW